jgi:hypothetical protein
VELRRTDEGGAIGARLEGRATASVIIGREDFRRLRLGPWEPAAGLSPCIRWCHDALGGAYVRWEFEVAENADIFHFARLEDAMRFVGLFSREHRPATADIRVAA